MIGSNMPQNALLGLVVGGGIVVDRVVTII